MKSLTFAESFSVRKIFLQLQVFASPWPQPALKICHDPVTGKAVKTEIKG